MSLFMAASIFPRIAPESIESKETESALPFLKIPTGQDSCPRNYPRRGEAQKN
jgi:hypothetical protein